MHTYSHTHNTTQVDPGEVPELVNKDKKLGLIKRNTKSMDNIPVGRVPNAILQTPKPHDKPLALAIAVPVGRRLEPLDANKSATPSTTTPGHIRIPYNPSPQGAGAIKGSTKVHAHAHT